MAYPSSSSQFFTFPVWFWQKLHSQNGKEMMLSVCVFFFGQNSVSFIVIHGRFLTWGGIIWSNITTPSLFSLSYFSATVGLIMMNSTPSERKNIKKCTFFFLRKCIAIFILKTNMRNSWCGLLCNDKPQLFSKQYLSYSWTNFNKPFIIGQEKVCT